MFNWFKQRTTHRHVAHQLYGAIVSQARQPAFYRAFGVADTISGRFEMICLHVFGVMERLSVAGATDTVGRELVERFFADMDDAMREQGVGDTIVPKKMRKASEALYGRMDAYSRAIRSEEGETLADALARNVYGETDFPDDDDRPRALAGYVGAMIAHLDELQDVAVVEKGMISFPDPST